MADEIDPLRAALEADPKVAELLAGDPLQAAIISDLITAYVDNVHAEHDALLGDIDNWKPRGFLGSQSVRRRSDTAPDAP